MKIFSSSDSLGALISISQPKDDDRHVNIDMEKAAEKNQSYSSEFQIMLDSLDQEECEEKLIMAKKRRLNSNQIMALERNFEVENKLKPETKVQLAEELGLQTRQVSIWFQNRRARWKNEQLERDYNVLKANYDSLKLNFDNLQQQNESLNEKVRQLKAKICRDGTESNQSVKEETQISAYEMELGKDSDKDEGIKMCEYFNFKDGSSSNAVKNAKYSIGLNGPPPPSSSSSSSSSSSNNLLMNWFQSQTQFMRMEEQSLFSNTEESCNFFSVDQAPTLHSYFPLQ